MVSLRPEQKLRSHLAHLADAAGRHFEFFTERGLDGIDDDGLRIQLLGRSKNFLDAHFGVDVQVVFANREPFPSQLDLVRRFLARSVENDRRGGEMRSDIEHERGFAHSGIAA